MDIFRVLTLRVPGLEKSNSSSPFSAVFHQSSIFQVNFLLSAGAQAHEAPALSMHEVFQSWALETVTLVDGQKLKFQYLLYFDKFLA